MNSENYLEALVDRAREGDPEALEEIVRAIQDRVYGLAMRMLGHPQDAQDAAQEILVKIVTHLSAFRRESTFTTWAYRIAANHLLTTRKRRQEMMGLTFAHIGELIDAGLALSEGMVAPEGDLRLLAEEIKIGCTQAMLLCLDREHRLAYILGEIFETNSNEGAAILDITPEAFRQRLARARKIMRAFLAEKCGLVNPASPCRCERQVAPALAAGKVKPAALVFATHPVRDHRQKAVANRRVKELHALNRSAALFRSHPDYAAPQAFVAAIRRLIDSGDYELLKRGN